MRTAIYAICYFTFIGHMVLVFECKYTQHVPKLLEKIVNQYFLKHVYGNDINRK